MASPTVMKVASEVEVSFLEVAPHLEASSLAAETPSLPVEALYPVVIPSPLVEELYPVVAPSPLEVAPSPLEVAHSPLEVAASYPVDLPSVVHHSVDLLVEAASQEVETAPTKW